MGGSKRWRPGQPTKGKRARSLPYSYCPYHHKRTWKSRAKAAEVAEQMTRAEADPDLPPVRVHWCPIAGAYHVTGSSQEEYDRNQTKHYARERDDDRTDPGPGTGPG